MQRHPVLLQEVEKNEMGLHTTVRYGVIRETCNNGLNLARVNRVNYSPTRTDFVVEHTQAI
jgi:hypothetical protein